MDRIIIDFDHSKGVIPAEIYGHFSELIGGVFYDGLWVGPDSPVENIGGFRKKLVDSFKRISPPVLRWPGGCFAETYDWRDGIGPRDKRPRRAGWWYSRDGRVETNQIGTHEFVHFCRLVGAEPYLAANLTSLPALHVRDWVEYCNFEAGTTELADERAANGDPAPFNVRYWGIGNENWGGGGQMTPEMCADEYIRFTTIMKSLGTKDLKFVMCGANGYDLDWTRRLMRQWSSRERHAVDTWGVSVHYYNSAFGGFDDVVFRNEEEWFDELFRAGFMRRIVDDHRAVMDEFDPERKLRLVVDEWGNWHKDGTGPSKGYNLFEQQSNMRDAVVAAQTLNIFNDRCDVVGMANVAQLCNNLHSLYLAADDGFAETPNYHVFAMFQGHKGGRHLYTSVSAKEAEHTKFGVLSTLSASASEKDGVLTLTMANLDLTASKEIVLSGTGRKVSGSGKLTVLHHQDPNTCNTFEYPDAVVPAEKDIVLRDGDSITVPPASVALLTLKLSKDDAVRA